MRLLRKLIIVFCLGFFLVAIPVSIVVPIVLAKKNDEKTNAFSANFGTIINWDDKKAKTMIDEKKDFVLFFGNTECGHCKEASETIDAAFADNSNNFKKTLEAAKKKNNDQAVFYWYYDTAPLGSEKVKKVLETVNKKIIAEAEGQVVAEEYQTFSATTKENSHQTITITEIKKIEGTPAILFFKKGKLVGQILGDIEDLTKNIEKGIETIWNVDIND